VKYYLTSPVTRAGTWTKVRYKFRLGKKTDVGWERLDLDFNDEQSRKSVQDWGRVIFSPDERTVGWTWSSFDRLRIKPGDVGVVTKIVEDALFIDDERGGFHWECFKAAS
jgi:hypothetical protein